MDLGSWTKDWPDLLPGGREPVTEYLSASIMVVLPHPSDSCVYVYIII